MNWNLFLCGIIFLLVAYLMYRWIKGEKPSSAKNGWNGPTGAAYVKYWGAIILCIMGGLAFIIKALLTHID
jgi:hypothetical protein